MCQTAAMPVSWYAPFSGNTSITLQSFSWQFQYQQMVAMQPLVNCFNSFRRAGFLTFATISYGVHACLRIFILRKLILAFSVFYKVLPATADRWINKIFNSFRCIATICRSPRYLHKREKPHTMIVPETRIAVDPDSTVDALFHV